MGFRMSAVLPVAFILFVCAAISQVTCADEEEGVGSIAEPARLRRCARDTSDCVEKAKNLVKRAIGCDLSNPYMDCFSKRSPIIYESPDMAKRAIGCDLGNPYMDCFAKRPAPVVPPQVAHKRAIGCDLSNPYMDCFSKRAVVIPEPEP